MKRNIFYQNKPAKVKRTAFDLSHEKKFSARMGQLLPIFSQEVVPGDTFKINTESLIRFAPMVFPVMHRIDAYIHYFYVPNRIIWDRWEKFITGDEERTLPTIPICTLQEALPLESIGDYLGYPTEIICADAELNALPFRAYELIWNEYYRDQNLQEDISSDIVGGGRDTFTNLASKPYFRAYEKDYFTSALPWAQKGDPVTMSADVNYRDEANVFNLSTEPHSNSPVTIDQPGSASGYHKLLYDDQGTLLGLENIEDITIDVSELRRATRLQRWLERNARSGTRYVEHLLSHWGVIPDDARLQRPEYIGGGKSPVMISEVLNTTGIDGELVMGTMAGHGINVGRTNEASCYCKEHGWIIGIMSVLPKTAYQQGVHKSLLRQTNLDFYYPEFAQLGEQPITTAELYFTSVPATNEQEWGYQSRYAEYKYGMNTVHGVFKDTLQDFHLGRKFSSKPELNPTFIQAIDTDFDHIFAADNLEQMYCNLYHKVTAIRPMPYYNDPKL